MDDVAVDDTPTIATEAVEETTPPAAKAAKPKRKSRAKAEVKEVKEVKEEIKEEPRGVPDPLLWAAVLKTQRTMEKEARSAKLSSLRIV